MCTYSQLKKIIKKLCVTAPFVPKLYAYSGKDISKCIEGGSMKFTTLVDYIYMCVQSRMRFRVMNVFFFNVFLNHFFFGFS